MTKTAEQIQTDYYAATADRYDKMHVAEGDEHFVALQFIAPLLRTIRARSVLDVGCGTGRGTEYLRRESGIGVYGVDPTRPLLSKAAAKGCSVVCGSGLALPFGDNAFDAAIELGVLHHVKRPEVVVKEMMRVARKGVFLSDSNFLGQGPRPVRIAKLGLYFAGLWPLVKWAQTRGRGYHFSVGDGISYSYSVYSQHRLLNCWADRVISIPLRGKGRLRSPLLSADVVLLCALKV